MIPAIPTSIFAKRRRWSESHIAASTAPAPTSPNRGARPGLPSWGDRIGRKPTLVITLIGTVSSYVLWAFAGSFALLIGARILGGIMAGNISTASAVIADTTDARNRVKGMGMIGMAIPVSS